MSKFIHIYDCEMSHANRDNGDILSLACVVARSSNLELVDSFIDYARPRNPQYWNKYAEGVHGIPMQKAMSFQPQRSLAVKLLHFLRPFKNEDNSPMPFVMHSSSWVDYAFVEKMYEKVELSDSFRKVANKQATIRTDLVFKEYLAAKGLPNNKSNLKMLAEEFGCDLNHHEAASDALACYFGLKGMLDFYKKRGPLRHPNIDFGGFNHLLSLYEGK